MSFGTTFAFSIILAFRNQIIELIKDIYLRIDTHFADIHGFMNVALVGAIP